MDPHSIKEADKVLDLTEAIPDDNRDNHSDVIVVDGRGYENNPSLEEDVYNLVDVVQDPSWDDRLPEDFYAKLEALVEKSVRQRLPEIAERIIREEIAKLKES